MIEAKTAYLILAHHQPAHLAKLVKSIRCDWAYIFIHVDAKFDMLQFKQLIFEDRNIIFLKENQRVKVNWGGFSQVTAILNLLKVALSLSSVAFDRYCLLSGSDFPIKELSYIQTQFSSQKEFIRIDRELGTSSNPKQSKKVKRFYFRDYPEFGGNWLSGIVPRKLNAKTKLYHGSQWWALTDEFIKYTFSFLKDNPDYIDFYKYTNASDEIFFHSIIKHSPFSENIIHDFEKSACLSDFMSVNEYGCHYMSWGEGDRSPKILDASDISFLIDSTALFARKFDEKISAELISILAQKGTAETL
jgi:Core-2/I-Branching enzyme